MLWSSFTSTVSEWWKPREVVCPSLPKTTRSDVKLVTWSRLCESVYTQQKLAISQNQGTPPPNPPPNGPTLSVIHLPSGYSSHKALQEAAFLQWGWGWGKSLNSAESRISFSQSLTLTCVNSRWTKPPEAWLDFLPLPPAVCRCADSWCLMPSIKWVYYHCWWLTPKHHPAASSAGFFWGKV